MPAPRLALVLAVLSAVLAGGCGASAEPGAGGKAALALGSAPSAVHSGIFIALARDFDGAEDVELRVPRRSRPADAVRLLDRGRADFAVLALDDLARARADGADVVGVMAIVQRPLAAVLARPGIRTPRNLEGRRVGVSGRPRDVAVLRSVVRGAGGDPRKVRRAAIRTGAVPDLAGGLVDAVTASWSVEGVALRRRLPGVREFRVERFGAPAYPELVLTTLRRTVQEQPGLVRGTVEALRRGYDEVLKDPELAVETMLPRTRGLDRAVLLGQLRAVSPALFAGAPRFGYLDRARLAAWSRWARRFGLVERAPEVGSMMVFRFANGPSGSG